MKKIIIENIITDYSVSNKGRIRNDLTNKILKPCSDGKYLQIAIFNIKFIYSTTIYVI